MDAFSKADEDRFKTGFNKGVSSDRRKSQKLANLVTAGTGTAVAAGALATKKKKD